MRIFRHYQRLPPEAKGSVAVLGNFDGVHRGHQEVIARGRAIADRLRAPLAVVTFEPHPRAFFAPDRPPFRLTTLRSKAHHLEQLGVEFLFALPFTLAFSKHLAEDFVIEALVEGLHVRHVVIGYDFCFGHQRGGGPTLLGWMGEMEDFGLTVVAPIRDGNDIFSSSLIREHLAVGKPQAAAELLGGWWEVEGRVRRGDARGRVLGYPTANLTLGKYLVPLLGIYAVRVGLMDADRAVTWHDGVASVGRRPTFGAGEVLLEVHLFDFNEDIYGRYLRVAFVDFIRPEKTFTCVETLKAAMAADCLAARRILAAPENQTERRFARVGRREPVDRFHS